MKWLLCKLFGHRWALVYAHAPKFRVCLRCGRDGYEVPS